MTLRDLASYPAQEAFSEIGAKYHQHVQELSAGIKGQSFAYGDDPYQEVAVFPAQAPNGVVLAFLHGGGWTNGYKEWMAFMAPPLNAVGVTFVSVGYRLAPQVYWPNGVQDAAAALRWIHDNIAEYGGDPERILVGGHSAGGHYAMWLAVRDDWQSALELPLDIVKGALPVSGVYDFTEGNGMPGRPRFLGDNEANDLDASPMFTLQKMPPVLMSWGEKDFPHLITQGERMEAIYREHGGHTETLVLVDCDHLAASYACGDAQQAWLSGVTTWISARNF
ncbi:MAG: alpha/beta hydrolase [Alphaproteobacteria bacterium]|nr:alpha/beta hydrolase [Alphaproteobacteria bacterium]